MLMAYPDTILTLDFFKKHLQYFNNNWKSLTYCAVFCKNSYLVHSN